MRAQACRAFWTGADAEAAGYVEVSSLCSLCGVAKDTLHHRLFCCSAVVEMRKEVLPDWLVDAACDTSDPEYEEELFLYGAFRHPGD
eukprot:5850446-Pyramimonas_sp.AAC.1